MHDLGAVLVRTKPVSLAVAAPAGVRGLLTKSWRKVLLEALRPHSQPYLCGQSRYWHELAAPGRRYTGAARSELVLPARESAHCA